VPVKKEAGTKLHRFRSRVIDDFVEPGHRNLSARCGREAGVHNVTEFKRPLYCIQHCMRLMPFPHDPKCYHVMQQVNFPVYHINHQRHSIRHFMLSDATSMTTIELAGHAATIVLQGLSPRINGLYDPL
jgi:hypothetical protein